MKALNRMSKQELQTFLNKLGGMIEDHLPREQHFCLIIFGPDRVGRYISNTSKTEAISELREFADVLELR